MPTYSCCSLSSSPTLTCTLQICTPYPAIDSVLPPAEYKSCGNGKLGSRCTSCCDTTMAMANGTQAPPLISRCQSRAQLKPTLRLPLCRLKCTQILTRVQPGCPKSSVPAALKTMISCGAPLPQPYSFLPLPDAWYLGRSPCSLEVAADLMYMALHRYRVLSSTYSPHTSLLGVRLWL